MAPGSAICTRASPRSEFLFKAEGGPIPDPRPPIPPCCLAVGSGRCSVGESGRVGEGIGGVSGGVGRVAASWGHCCAGTDGGSARSVSLEPKRVGCLGGLVRSSMADRPEGGATNVGGEHP